MYLSKILNISKLSTVALVMGCALLGGGVTASHAGDEEVNLDGSTPHGTFIEQGTDPALVGMWRVEQVQIEQGSQTIVFPVSGAVLTILDGGSFKYDYTTETNGPRATDIVSGQPISATRTSPVATCKMEATGEYIGHANVYWDEDANTTTLVGAYPELQITVFMDRSTRAEVRCAGSSEVVTNATTPSLGFARINGSGDAGPYVSYSYIYDGDAFSAGGGNGLIDLEIWTITDDPVRTRYFLRKLN